MKKRTWIGYLIASIIILGAWLQFDTNNGYLRLDEVEDPYQVDQQQEIHQEIETLKTNNSYNEEHMLMIYNPYGTNTLGMYVYFETEDAVSIAYTIHVNDQDINDFTRKLNDDFQMVHEYQLIGLVPEAANTITFTLMKEDGTSTSITKDVYIEALKGTEPYQLEVSEGISKEPLSNGLYVIFGNDSDDENGDNFMYFYDHDGVLRSEIAISDIRSHRLVWKDNLMYFSNSTSSIAAMDPLGQIQKIYDLDGFTLHHDYILEENRLLVLATDPESSTVQDRILSIDLNDGSVTQIVDMKQLLISYYETCIDISSDTLDWMHLNSIQSMGSGDILVSSRETSTIIKISNLDEEPSISYMIGDQSFWKDSEYASLLLDKTGSFTTQCGQHSLQYIADDALPDGQYYLIMFNNNFGFSKTQGSFDWGLLPGVALKTTDQTASSKYYRYLVDETNNTYELVESFDLPYSAYISSVQDIEGNTVIDSGSKKTFQEYDGEHQLIRSYRLDHESFIYRVYKYSFDGFYFHTVS